MKIKKFQSHFKALSLGALTLAALPAVQAADRLPETTTTAAAGTGGHYTGPGGLYGNPEWTKHRRFATTRVFVQRDPWEVGFEQWWRFRTFDDKGTQHLFSEEIEIGLPFRAQLDLYYDWTHEEGESEFKDFAAEIRWALADWDVIPLNPTLYAEYKFVDEDRGGDVVELKLLLGDDIGQDFHYGINFVWEKELGGEERATELQALVAGSYDFSQSFSAGFEAKYVHETVAGHRSDPEHKLLLGPSIQWRPTENSHLNLVGLFGLTEDAPNVEGWVVFGFDFGRIGGDDHKVQQPVSSMR